MFQKARLSVGFCLIWLSPLLARPQEPSVPTTESLAAAHTLLHGIVDTDETWVKIHAAEALLAGGEGPAIRAQFATFLPSINSRVYRVGVYRVLAESAESPAEAGRLVAAVEKIYLNPRSPDRSQAVETLCKLGVRLEGQALEQATTESVIEQAPFQPLSLWALANSGDPTAVNHLADLLTSSDERIRLDAAYALRWLHPKNATVLAALAHAADHESLKASSYPYVTSAAFATSSSPDRRQAWRESLEDIIATGPAPARFEAVQGLMNDLKPEDERLVTPLLTHRERDAQVAGAWALFHLAAKPSSAK